MCQLRAKASLALLLFWPRAFPESAAQASVRDLPVLLQLPWPPHTSDESRQGGKACRQHAELAGTLTGCSASLCSDKVGSDSALALQLTGQEGSSMPRITISRALLHAAVGRRSEHNSARLLRMKHPRARVTVLLDAS